MILNDTSTTLNGILQDIYFLGKCNVNTFTRGDYLRIVNKYYGQCQEVIKGVNENFYQATATTDLVIGDGSYTYPDGTGTAPAYTKMKSIWVAFLPANSAAPLATEYMRANVADPDSISDPSYTFTQSTALMYGTYFVLLPLVTDVTKYPVTDGVKVYYIAEVPPLVNDTDAPLIFKSFQDAIVQGSLIDIADRLGNEQLKIESEKTFKKRLQDLAAFASNRLPPEISIIEGQENQGGFTYPWGQSSMS